MTISGTTTELRHRTHAAGGNVVLHSRHYNTALLRTLLEVERVDTRSILERAAAEVVYEHLCEELAREDSIDSRERLHRVAELFREAGLGALDLAGIDRSGGELRVRGSHWALGWSHRFGAATEPVCPLVAGFVAGALAAVFGQAYQVREVKCAAQGADTCRFLVAPVPTPLDLGSGDLHPAPSLAPPPPLDRPALEAEELVGLLGAALTPAGPEGTLEAFGDQLSRLWTDLYNKVSYRFEQQVPQVMGAKFTNLPGIVLTEAGHACAFYTLGGLALSREWEERVRPHLRTREDWAHALVAAVNALGWGTWRLHALLPAQRLIVHVYDGYEALGYRRLFGAATAPKCYLARGVVAAIMNLVYVGDLSARPALTPAYYNQLFRSPLSFRALETRCRATDDPFCEVVANPLSPGLSGFPR